jgi:PAS domain S-box-containing protein
MCRRTDDCSQLSNLIWSRSTKCDGGRAAHLNGERPGVNADAAAMEHVSETDTAPDRVSEAKMTQAERAARHANAFSELGRRLSSATNPRGAAQIIAEAADALFGWDACVLDLWSSRQNTMETVFCVDTVNGKRTEFALQERQPGAIAFEVLRDGARLILRSDPPAFEQGFIPLGDNNRPSASLMYVPLRDEQQAIGIFSIQSYRANAYSEQDLATLQALAEHCSGALARIRAEEEIQRLNRELRRHLEELQTIFNVAPVGIAVSHDPECRTLTGNPACQALFGANGVIVLSEAGDAAKRPFRLLRDGQEIPFEEMPMQRVARQGAPVRGEELDLVFPDGRTVNTLISASPLYDEAGRLRGSLAVIVDLTQRKRAEQEILRLNANLEQRVRQRTAQIEAINKELEAFCYSVSHDLRAPLRSIRGFSEVLLERYAGNLDAQGQEFLRRACQSSVQMDVLIEDLLKLSRVSRSEIQWQNCDLSALADRIVEELRRSEPQRAAECQIARNLQARGDQGLLRIVLENLLQNAWKFTGKQPRPRIEFNMTSDPQRAFFIRDNGAGFDMAHADRLFGVFQRLHSASEFPGTGVGLATVQRIINRHGGRAWAVGAPSQGTTFYFTLPDQPLC